MKPVELFLADELPAAYLLEQFDIQY